MNGSFVKTAMVIILCFLFVNSCKLDTSKISDEKFQVYDENGNPVKGDGLLVGKPHATWKGVTIIPSKEVSWQIEGKIINGKMAVDFPDKKLELNSNYEYLYNDGNSALNKY